MSEEIKETRQEGILFTIDCLKNHKFNFDYCLDELIEETTNLQTQLQQKENIIKEVREYINNHLYMESTGGIQHPTFDGKMNRDTDGFEMLEILDKVGDEISK